MFGDLEGETGSIEGKYTRIPMDKARNLNHFSSEHPSTKSLFAACS